MLCKKCGQQNQEDASFCEACGTPSALIAKTEGGAANSAFSKDKSSGNSFHRGFALKLPIKKRTLIILSVIILFVLLNPTRQDFNEYSGLPDNNGGSGVEKIHNFLICSVYKYQNDFYIGVLKNFFLVNDYSDY